MFQHTAARRRLGGRKSLQTRTKKVSTHSRPKAAGHIRNGAGIGRKFQHTAARRRLGIATDTQIKNTEFQHTAARRRLGRKRSHRPSFQQVSTHSRPKAAGSGTRPDARLGRGFNTQPPEGGWLYRLCLSHLQTPRFQHTAARRRLVDTVKTLAPGLMFQHTAARRRLDLSQNAGTSRE